MLRMLGRLNNSKLRLKNVRNKINKNGKSSKRRNLRIWIKRKLKESERM